MRNFSFSINRRSLKRKWKRFVCAVGGHDWTVWRTGHFVKPSGTRDIKLPGERRDVRHCSRCWKVETRQAAQKIARPESWLRPEEWQEEDQESP